MKLLRPLLSARLVAGVVAGLSSAALAAAAPSLPFAGQQLRVLSFHNNHSDAVAQQLDAFERLTGAKVEFDTVAENAVAAKIATDQAGGGSYDLYTVDEPYLPQLAPFFLPLSGWPKAAVAGLEELNLAAYLPAAVAAGRYGQEGYGLPVNGNVYMYVYRRDLWSSPFEQAAFLTRYHYPLQLPQTTAQMHDMAAFFTRPPQLYGFAPFTKVSEGTTVEVFWLLASFGVEWRVDDLDRTFPVDRVAEALRFYQDMMHYAPPGAANWHHVERMAAYSKGRLAQMLTWPSYLKALEDPARSLVVGKSAYGLPPAGVGGRSAAVVGSWVVAIPKTSRQPALAAAFARWWGSKDAGARLVAGGMNPARSDLLEAPALVRQNPWFPSILANFQVALVRPRVTVYRQVSEVLSVHFTEMTSGQASPEAAARGMKKDLLKLLAPAVKP